MRFRLRTLLIVLAKFFWRAPPRTADGCCAYCRNNDSNLQEVPGPIGTGGVFVCKECADSCISLVS
jgi:hypothetical protein